MNPSVGTEENLRYNLFKYATSELSHSAFWAWVLQSLDSETNELAAPRHLAQQFLKKIKFSDFVLPGIKVFTEHCLEGDKKDRFDIYMKDESGRVLVVENKVKAIPYADQPNRYEKSLKKEAKVFKVVILSISFDLDVRQTLGCCYVGLEDIIQMMDPEVISHPLIRDYHLFLVARFFTRQRILKAIETGNKQDFEVALSTAEGQWLLMELLTKGMEGHQYRGQNLSGSPWTQFCFFEVSGGDALFYRIDCSTKGPYFSLRQYQDKPDSGKKERLQRYRATWAAICKSRFGDNLKIRPPRQRGNKESEIGWFLFKENEISFVKEALPLIYSDFKRDLIPIIC